MANYTFFFVLSFTSRSCRSADAAVRLDFFRSGGMTNLVIGSDGSITAAVEWAETGGDGGDWAREGGVQHGKSGDPGGLVDIRTP